jgi:hypothetical protein
MVEKSTEPGNSDKPPSLREWFEKRLHYRHGTNAEQWTPLACSRCGYPVRFHTNTCPEVINPS